MKLRIGLWLVLFTLAAALTGCGGSDSSDPAPTVYARVDAEALPLPNDVTWGGGPVNLPPSDGDSLEMAQLKAVVNSLGIYGLSPNMFLTLPVTGPVDSSTLELLIFRSNDPNLPTLLTALATNDLATVATTLPQMEFRDQNDFVIVDDFANGVVKLLPKTPFTPGGAYVVVVPDTLRAASGDLVVSSVAMQALKSTTPIPSTSAVAAFEPVRAAFNDGPTALFNVVAGVTGAVTGTPWTRDDVLVMWTFGTAAKTLSLSPPSTIDYPAGASDPFNGFTAVLKGLSDGFTANALTWTNPATGADAPGPVGIPAALALSGTGIPTDQLGNLYTGYFQSPVFATGGATTTKVTFRLVLPAEPIVPGYYPVVLFQHGIGSSKNAALPIANSLASVGYATMAIDAIFHGDRTTPGAESGDGFLSVNLLQSRANFYQAALDLWETVDVLYSAGFDVDGANGNDLLGSRVQFVGHSLGSIIGSVFLSQEELVARMVFSSPSAELANVFDEIQLASVQELLAPLGMTPGTLNYYIFLNLIQWLMDPVDATYMGIGEHSSSDLMALYAYGDPIVTPSSSQVFLTNLGQDLADTRVIDPDDVSASYPGPAEMVAGAYRYGLAGKPVVHSFLLSPLINVAEEPYYADYSGPLQLKATTGAQTQVAGFLMQALNPE